MHLSNGVNNATLRSRTPRACLYTCYIFHFRSPASRDHLHAVPTQTIYEMSQSQTVNVMQSYRGLLAPKYHVECPPYNLQEYTPLSTCNCISRLAGSSEFL